MNKIIINNIKSSLKELKLAGVVRNIDELLTDAYKDNIGYKIFLDEILILSLDNRRENGKTNRIRNAKFPYKKSLDDLDLNYLPKAGVDRLKELRSLNFIKEGISVIFSGNCGTGKTHTAIGLGIEACNAGYKVFFTTIPLLINELKECRSENRLRSMEKKFEKYELIICDELVYISFDKEGSELLFTFLSLRAERKSTILISNLMFDKWNEVFNDPVLTAALVDRLTHKAYVINTNGNSYRTKETLEMLKK